jgi:hypothetical protein
MAATQPLVEERAMPTIETFTGNVPTRALTREFRLFTEGTEPGIDALAIIHEVLKGLPDNERSAALFWVADYYGYTLAQKR